MTRLATFTNVYRTGGYAMCEWQKCLPVETREHAQSQRADIERMGYKTLTFKTHEAAPGRVPAAPSGRAPRRSGGGAYPSVTSSSVAGLRIAVLVEIVALAAAAVA